MKSAIETLIENIKIASSAAILACLMTLGTEAKADQFESASRLGSAINHDSVKYELSAR